MEDRRLTKLREDRLRAYSELARVTKVLRPTAHGEAGDLVEVLSEIELLTDDPQLLKIAAELVSKAELVRIAAWKLHERGEGTVEGINAASAEVSELRKRYMEAAKKELDAKPERS